MCFSQMSGLIKDVTIPYLALSLAWNRSVPKCVGALASVQLSSCFLGRLLFSLIPIGSSVFLSFKLKCTVTQWAKDASCTLVSKSGII